MTVDEGSGSNSGDRRLDGKQATQIVISLQVDSAQGTILQIKYKWKTYGSGGFRSPREPLSGTTIVATVALTAIMFVGLLCWVKKRYCEDKSVGEAAFLFKDKIKGTFDETADAIRKRRIGEVLTEKLCDDDVGTVDTEEDTGGNSSYYDADLVEMAMRRDINCNTERRSHADAVCIDCVNNSKQDENKKNKTFMLTSLLLGALYIAKEFLAKKLVPELSSSRKKQTIDEYENMSEDEGK